MDSQQPHPVVRHFWKLFAITCVGGLAWMLYEKKYPEIKIETQAYGTLNSAKRNPDDSRAVGYFNTPTGNRIDRQLSLVDPIV